MFDRDKKGTININEFGALFGYINQWKGTFEGYDRDRSGFIEQNELSSGIYLCLLQICMIKITVGLLTCLNLSVYSRLSINGKRLLNLLTKTGVVALNKLSFHKVTIQILNSKVSAHQSFARWQNTSFD